MKFLTNLVSFPLVFLFWFIGLPIMVTISGTPRARLRWFKYTRLA